MQPSILEEPSPCFFLGKRIRPRIYAIRTNGTDFPNIIFVINCTHFGVFTLKVFQLGIPSKFHYKLIPLLLSHLKSSEVKQFA